MSEHPATLHVQYWGDVPPANQSVPWLGDHLRVLLRPTINAEEQEILQAAADRGPALAKHFEGVARAGKVVLEVRQEVVRLQQSPDPAADFAARIAWAMTWPTELSDEIFIAYWRMRRRMRDELVTLDEEGHVQPLPLIPWQDEVPLAAVPDFAPHV